MDWIEIQQQWPQYKGRVQRHWSSLTDNDLERIAGNKDLLVARIKEVYGTTQEQAQKAVDEFARSITPIETRRGMRSFSEMIRGLTVIAADGRVVGEVTDLLVNSETWSVESVQLKLDKDAADELGVKRGMFHAGTVNVPVRMIQSIGDSVILTVAARGLRPTINAFKNAA